MSTNVVSQVEALEDVLAKKYNIDYFQREYVWQDKQIEDLLNDLTSEFNRQWHNHTNIQDVASFDPYFMGEIIVSGGNLKSTLSIIDGQQRLTSFTLLLIYLVHRCADITKFEGFPLDEIKTLICRNYYGKLNFNLDIPERINCMESLFKTGKYNVKDDDDNSVKNVYNVYLKIEEVFNDKVNEQDIVAFSFWLKNKVLFSNVWSNSDEFAYIIFETMNDRGLSLTQVEMLRSYLLSKIDENNDRRVEYMHKFDKVVGLLKKIQLASKSKAEFEFFKIFFRTHYAEDLTQGNTTSDFVKIGKEFHRWVSDNSKKLKLNCSNDYCRLIDEISYFANVYKKLYTYVENCDYHDFLYLVVNNDYGFTLQPALILAAIKYGDDDNIVKQKIKCVSKYLTKLLSWRIWCGNVISQSKLEAPIYDLAKMIRDKDLEDVKQILRKQDENIPCMDENTPVLNQQNKPKIKVLLGLITAIVGRESDDFQYILRRKEIQVEHIWADIYSRHKDEFSDESSFAQRRNTIGDLLLLPKSFNASYGKAPFSEKIEYYLQQNILAQSLNVEKYRHNPSFMDFVQRSHLRFVGYKDFKSASIMERTDLYREILKWNWSNENIE